MKSSVPSNSNSSPSSSLDNVNRARARAYAQISARLGSIATLLSRRDGSTRLGFPNLFLPSPFFSYLSSHLLGLRCRRRWSPLLPPRSLSSSPLSSLLPPPSAGVVASSIRRHRHLRDLPLLFPFLFLQGKELKARLRKLEEVAEKKAYEELVKDITPKKGTDEPFSSYKDQLGFGLHVVVTMFTGYLVGYAAFRALFSHSPVMNAAGGILGLVCGMLLETLIFIIRTSNQDIRSSSTSKIKKNQ
ncbi:uncharacterized protein LOC127813214 isoform X1 [Diospyros lotus]|uniref:uncharacterized protein LOC127813214 isoform X1 n=1 Tax=Diospyros lotus TaxID=55363 RepID=UPI002258E87E|nr:uncharacterized protein LOC127813214 isoform X1 [Diospyros lotus]